MTDKSFLKYAYENGLKPIAWFEISYPAYAIKVKYKYPTADPADFRDRALLQLIDIGIPYSTACAILMVTDPHKAILRRFKSDNPGPQLVRFDIRLNRDVLTPLGKQKIERIELARDGIACCFIDGFSGEPFPKDVVDNLKDRYNCREVVFIPEGLYPFEAGIESKIIEINAKLNEGKGKGYRKRLRLPEKATDTSMTPLGPKWMRNISMGIFLKENSVVRRIFCDKEKTVEPFGWLKSINGFKLTRNQKKNTFAYTITDPTESSVFTTKLKQSNSSVLRSSILSILEKEYGREFVNQCDLVIDFDSNSFSLNIKGLDVTIGHRSKLLTFIVNGVIPIRLPGMTGSLFIAVAASEKLSVLGEIRKTINESESDWPEIVESLKKQYPTNWRQIVIEIGRHDILFRYDIEHFIKYGK